MATLPVAKHLSDCVAEHMRTEFPRLAARQTVAEALAAIRESNPKERIIYFYVVDQDGRLEGVVPTRRLLLSPLGTRIEDIMVREVTVLPQTATVLDACEFFVLHRLLAFPVVDRQRRMIGVVDIELYTSELTDLDRSARIDNLFQLVGVHYAEAQLASPLWAFRNRFPWLLANVAGGVVAAFLSGIFRAELKAFVALALFIPVVLTVSEGVTIQSVSLALQALHGRRPTARGILWKACSEAITGIFLGVACAALVAAVARLWLGEYTVAFVLFGGIVGSVACAAVVGVVVPNLLRLLRRIPASLPAPWPWPPPTRPRCWSISASPTGYSSVRPARFRPPSPVRGAETIRYCRHLLSQSFRSVAMVWSRCALRRSTWGFLHYSLRATRSAGERCAWTPELGTPRYLLLVIDARVVALLS